jgi:hypothetical protein
MNRPNPFARESIWDYEGDEPDPGPDWGTPEAAELMHNAAGEARLWLAMNAAYGRMLDHAQDTESNDYRVAADEFATLKAQAEARSAR